MKKILVFFIITALAITTSVVVVVTAAWDNNSGEAVGNGETEQFDFENDVVSESDGYGSNGQIFYTITREPCTNLSYYYFKGDFLSTVYWEVDKMMQLDGQFEGCLVLTVDFYDETDKNPKKEEYDGAIVFICGKCESCDAIRASRESRWKYYITESIKTN